MMAYVESFARAMERARASVSYWDRKTLDHLQAAHDAEMRQCSKSEYHRGYEDGKATKSADQWQLDRERARIIRKLDALMLNADGGSHYNLSTVCKAVYEPSFGWTMGACERLRDRLIALLGTQDTRNATDFARNQQNGPKSGKKQPEMQRNQPKSRDSLQEVQSPSITDELRKWFKDRIFMGNGWQEIRDIADRIDEQFNRICSQHESVLQQTISDTVDEHEREMAELRADYERATKMQREYGEKVADLQAELRAAKHLHECNQRWCDALLDLIRDAAKDYRTASKVARRLQERASELRRERDELQDRLQAISVLCEQDDG